MWSQIQIKCRIYKDYGSRAVGLEVMVDVGENICHVLDCILVGKHEPSLQISGRVRRLPRCPKTQRTFKENIMQLEQARDKLILKLRGADCSNSPAE